VATSVAKRMKNHTALANSKKDQSPKWDGHESWTTREFYSKFRASMNWYSENKTGKELKPNVINWMALNNYEKEVIQKFKNTKDGRCGTTVGAVASCLLKGMPEVRTDFNNGRSTGKWLRTEIDKILLEGSHDKPDEEKIQVIKNVNPITTIQDRIREQASSMSEEIDLAIDSFIKDPESFDPKQYSLVKIFRGKGVKAAHARYIKGFYQFGQNELLELASGEADAQLKEAYKHLPRKYVKKLIDFYQLIMDSCDQVSAEAKVLKKPRAKKVKPAEDLVKKLKFKTSDDKLGIVSISPAQIIKAQSVLIYNVKTRKIGYYISKNSEGLQVKGTSLTNYTDLSIQKTLRKPADQLKELKEQNTQKRIETWFNKNIKTTETKLNGRFNEDTVILKVFK